MKMKEFTTYDVGKFGENACIKFLKKTKKYKRFPMNDKLKKLLKIRLDYWKGAKIIVCII